VLPLAAQACKNQSRAKQAQLAAEQKQQEAAGGGQQLPLPMPQQQLLLPVQQLQAQMPMEPTTHNPLYAAGLMGHDPSASLASLSCSGQYFNGIKIFLRLFSRTCHQHV